MEENFKNMKGQLEIMKTLGIKPNFSELERAFIILYIVKLKQEKMLKDV